MAVVPIFGALMWSAANEERLSKLVERMALPPDVQAVPHTGGWQMKVGQNLAWAKTT